MSQIKMKNKTISVLKTSTQNIIVSLGLNSGYGRVLKQLLDIMHVKKEGIKDE